jgi:hypothetical protein
MFRSYDHLQAEMYTSEINITDNGSVVFRILVNLVDNGDGFLATVDVVAVAELIIANCCTYLAGCKHPRLKRSLYTIFKLACE